MAGLERDTPVPSGITLHTQSRVLELQYADGSTYRLPFEFLRVYSPSAEVRGHGPGQETLQTGKRDVTVTSIDAVGHYAIQPTFSHRHSSGIYSWDHLYDLAARQETLWQEYLQTLAQAGVDRDAPMSAARHGGHGHGHRHN